MVTHLLELVHAMWTTRNNVLHERAENGETLEQAQQLDTQICEEFDKGVEDIHPRDLHFFEHGLDDILGLTGVEQQSLVGRSGGCSSFLCGKLRCGSGIDAAFSLGLVGFSQLIGVYPRLATANAVETIPSGRQQKNLHPI